MASSNRVLRLGLVGRGRWGSNIERTLRSLPDVQVAVISRGEHPPADIDAVLIVTPGATHADVARSYIERGLPTFIEKPMTTSIEDARQLSEAAQRSGAPIFVGHIYLYNPAFQCLIDLVQTLGPVRHVFCEAAGSNIWAHASLIWEWLPHHLSMARALSGRDPHSVEAWDLSSEPGPRVAFANFLFGTVPAVSVMSSVPVKRRVVTVSYETGTVVFDDTAERKLTLHGPDGGVSYPAYGREAPLTSEMKAFLGVVRSGATDRRHADEATAIVEAISAAERSMNRGGARVEIVAKQTAASTGLLNDGSAASP